MESEKVKEIKKALEYIVNEDFCFLPYIDGKDKQNTVAYADILTLINELESENERLNNTEIGELIKENDYLEKQCVEWSELDFKKRNKIEQLKDRIAELQEDKEKWQRKAVNYYQRAKSYGIECIIDNDIDETLKEFIDD